MHHTVFSRQVFARRPDLLHSKPSPKHVTNPPLLFLAMLLQQFFALWVLLPHAELPSPLGGIFVFLHCGSKPRFHLYLVDSCAVQSFSSCRQRDGTRALFIDLQSLKSMGDHGFDTPPRQWSFFAQDQPWWCRLKLDLREFLCPQSASS